MKNTKKVWIALITFGLILMVIGFLAGAKQGFYFDTSGIHIIENKEYKTEELNLEEIKNIDINIENVEIKFEESDQYGIEIAYYGEKSNINWNIKDGNLKVIEEKEEAFRFSSVDLSFFSGIKKSYVKIYTPKESVLDSVTANTKNGNIDIAKLIAKHVIIGNNYGNISLREINVSNIEIKLDSGNLEVKNIISDKMTVQNIYGKVTLDTVDIKAIKMQMNSGNLKLKNLKAEDIQIKSNYGKVIADEIETINTMINVDSGDVRINGDLIGNTTIDSSYGSVKINTKREKEYYECDMNTDYGKIIIDEKTYKEKEMYVTNSSLTNRLKIHANSGNININFNQNT